MVKSSSSSSKSDAAAGRVLAFLKLTPHRQAHHFYEISSVAGSANSVRVRFGRVGRKGRSMTVSCKTGVSPKETALRLAARRLRSSSSSSSSSTAVWHLYDPQNTRSRKPGNQIQAITRAIRTLRQQRTTRSTAAIAKKTAKRSAKSSASSSSSASASSTKKTATKRTATPKTTRKTPSAFSFDFSGSSYGGSAIPDDTGIFHYPGAIRPSSQTALLEIVFSFDTTGSMSSYLADVREKLRTILTQLLADLPFIRISIIAHGDFCDSRSSYVLKMLDLSNDTDEIVKFVSGVSGTGGGDSDECYELVLQQVADKTSWSPASAKALVVIGDASPHPPTTYKRIDWHAELARLKSKNVRVYGVHVGSQSQAKDFYETIAKETGGAYLTLDRVDTLREMMLGLCYLEATEQQGQHITDSAAAAAAAASASTSGDIALPTDVAGALDSEAADVTRAVGDGGDDDNDEMEVDSASSARKRLTDDDVMRIHNAIHSSGTSNVTIDDQEHAVSIGSAGCRFVRVNGTTFIEQNKLKSSRFAKMALDEGKKITWVVRRGRWGLIIDDKIVRR